MRRIGLVPTAFSLSRIKIRKKTLLLVSLAVLFTTPALVGAVQQASGLATVNPSNTPGATASATLYPSQNKVFYANGYWWVFWGSAGGTHGIYYESSADGKTWSTPTTFTNAESPTNGGAEFDAFLSGTTLYYVVAPASGGSKFWFGAATLQATGTIAWVVQDASHTLATFGGTRIGTTSPRASIAVDGNGYVTMAITTSNTGATIFYVDGYQCTSSISVCASGGSWNTVSYTLSTTAVADLTTPSILPLSSSGTYYDALVYDDAKSTGGAPGYGPMDVWIMTSGVFTKPASVTCSPASQFYDDLNYGATYSGSTVYVTNTYFGGGTYAFSCPVGGPASAEDPISASSFVSALGMDGSTIIAVYPTGANVQSWESTNGAVSFSNGPNVAQNTETANLGLSSPGQPEISPVAYTVNGIQEMGVIWMDGNYVRFAAYSLTNFAVTVNIALSEYQIPQTTWYPLTPSNEFQISYTQCPAGSCTSPVAATAFYGSCSSLQGSCTTASPSYGCNTGATAGCYMTIPNVESYTTVTIAATSTGSTANERWCISINTASGGTCAATSIGSSDGLPSTVTVGATQYSAYVSYVYYDILANPSKYTLQPSSPSPPSTPTVQMTTASTTAKYTSNPSTNTYNQGASTTTWWLAKNGTDFASASISGTSSDQWAANPSNLAWTVTTWNQINPNIVYYHQYLNLFQINSGGSQQFDGSGQFILYGSQYGIANTPIANYIPSGVSTYSTDLWTDAGTTVSFPSSATGTPSGARWQACPTGVAACSSNTLTTSALNNGVGVNPTGYSVLYYKQWSQILAYSTNDGSTMPSTPPISFTSFGQSYNKAMNVTSSTVWMDAGTTANVTLTYTGGTGERWQTTASSWSITGQNLIPTPTLVYYHQFQEPNYYTTSDNSVPLTLPKMTLTEFGHIRTVNINTTSYTPWLDAGTTVTIPGIIPGTNPATEEWLTNPASWTITGYNIIDPTSGNIAYTHQYTVTFVANPPSEGYTTPSGTNVWEPANQQISVLATFISGYQFNGWTVTAGVTVASASAQSTTMKLTAGGGTLTANFLVISGLSFAETGLNLDGPSWSVILNSWPSGYTPPCAPSGSTYVCSSSSQSISLPNAPVGSYTYSVSSPQQWTSGLQYLVTSCTSNCNVQVNPTAGVQVTFQSQFLLSWSQLPGNAGTISVVVNSGLCFSGLNSTSYWCNAGTVVTLTATATAQGASFLSWTRVVCTQGASSNICTTTVNGPAASLAMANFFAPLSLTISTPMPESGSPGGQSIAQLVVTGGQGDITLSYGTTPSFASISFSQNNFAGNVQGVNVNMIVTLASNAGYGQFSWSVTATDGGGQTATQTYTLVIQSPTISTVGYSTSQFAITYPGQSALIFAPGSPGHWFAFYSDGTHLVYSSSTDQFGTSWTAPVIFGAGAAGESAGGSGYSFAVAYYNGQIYYVVISSTLQPKFYYNIGTVSSGASGATISWQYATDQARALTIPAGDTSLNAAGSPSLLVSSNAGCMGCIYVAIPALDNNLDWHVQLFQYTTFWSAPIDINVHTAFNTVGSIAHAQIFQLTDGIGMLWTHGDTPLIPRMTVVNYAFSAANTFVDASSAVGFYEQQSQAVAMGDTIYFAGLASDRNVYAYNFVYNPNTQTGTFSVPVRINGVGTLTAASIVNHSWHLSLTTQGTSLVLAYGIDGDLYFTVSSDGGNTWSAPVVVQGVQQLVNGVTAAYSGQTVAVVWVDKVASAKYAIRFAEI